MENGTTGQPWDPTKTMGIGTGEGEIPLATPPSAKLDARTMSSDLRSMQQSGGAMPRPYAPQSTPSTAAPARPPVPQVPVPSVSQSAPASPLSSAASFAAPVEKKGGKNIFVISLVAVLVAGLGALGYFVLYPMIFGESAVPPASEEVQTPSVPAPAPTTELTPEPTPTPSDSLPSSESGSTPAPTPVSALAHTSYFKIAADETKNLSLTNLTFPSLFSLLSFETSAVPFFKELAGKNTTGAVLTFEQFAGTSFPSVFTPEVVAQFEPDFTLFSLTNEKGTWLGFVAKKSTTASSQLPSLVAKIESSPTLQGFFLKTPGIMQAWKVGKVGTTDTRYASFQLAGAAFNYGWSGDYLVVSASYDAFKEALRRLQ